MNRLPRSTAEQWGVLRSVVEDGGFAQAAAALNRSQSSVSYAIARLQETLGVALLEPQGRRAVLTEAGSALLADAIPLLDELARLERRAAAIAAGEAVRIRLLVDSLFPKERLFAALSRFAVSHPHAEVHLRETVRQSIADVGSEDYDLAILVADAGQQWTEPVADIALIAVARHDHPLIRDGREPGEAALARHPRAEIRGLEAARAMPGGEGRVWRMNTVETAIEAVRHGLCYGWLPQRLIARDLEAGTLAALPLATGGVRHIPLGLRFGDRRVPDDTPLAGLAALLADREIDCREIDCREID